MQTQKKLESQDLEVYQMQQQIKELQQQNDDIKNAHKIEIKKIKKKLSHNNNEIHRLRNYNKTLLSQIKKLKNKKQADQKLEQVKQDFTKKLFEKNEKICHRKSYSQDSIEKIKKLEDERKSQQETSNKELMINNKRMTKLDELKNLLVKNIQTSNKGTNTNLVELSKVEESSNKQDSQEKRMPYRHPNHKSCYDQRQCQEDYKKYSSYRETNYNIEKERRQNRQFMWKL